MILRDGFRTYEFQPGLKKPDTGDKTPLKFASGDDALAWLKRLGFLHSNLIYRLRNYVAGQCDDPETFRVTGHNALERLATLLHQGRIAVTYRDEHAVAGTAAPIVAPAPAFPLSERSQRDASSPAQQTAANDPSTFDPNVDGAAQAAALEAAAADGKPFCPE